jgi:hypothetical protein
LKGVYPGHPRILVPQIPEAYPVKNGHHPNISNVLLDIYRLLTIFMASKGIAELEMPLPHLYAEDPLQRFDEFESDEMTRILLTVAITIRVIDDRESKSFDFLALNCGCLTPNTGDAMRVSDLTVREACNKVLHASKIEFERTTLPNGRCFLQPRIHLFGTDYRRQTWQANLDIVLFCRECTSILKLLS